MRNQLNIYNNKILHVLCITDIFLKQMRNQRIMNSFKYLLLLRVL